VTIDCADPAGLAAFWASALGYVVQPPPEGYDSWPAFLRTIGVPESDLGNASACVDPDGKGPRLFFQKVPEGKAAKNRVHLDVNVGPGNVEAEVARLVSEGATRVEAFDVPLGTWVVMTDPEGNEFCVQ